MKDSELRMAVIGASGHAARVAAPTIAADPGARLVGVLGSSPDSGGRLAAQHPGARPYTDLSALLADDGVDGVWIAGPNHLHADLTSACLRAGKHVLVEKPLATTADEAGRTAGIAEEADRIAVVDYQHRFRPGHLWLHDRLAEGLVGRVRSVRIHRCWPYPYYPDMPADISGSWRASVADGGGWALNDIGSHLVDLALWLSGGTAVPVWSRTGNLRFTDVEAEDTALVVAETPDGATLIVETSNAMSSFPGTIEVHGDAGWVRADGTFDDTGVIATSAGERREFSTTAPAVYAASLADFLARVGGGHAVGATAAQAVATTRIVEWAARRHRGRPAD
jgi:predicted dehydrogenase